MMKLIPYESFTITTSDPVGVLTERLSVKVGPLRWFSRYPGSQIYWGKVWTTGFKVMRIIDYRNSFLPVICGRFQELSEGTVIHVTMRLHSWVLIFLTIWCIFLGLVFFKMLEVVRENGDAWPALIVPVVMVLFALVLTVIGFRWEVPGNREEISRLLVGS